MPHRPIDPKTLDHLQGYHLMTSLLIPRPIGWISTISTAGTVNLAPFSFFNAVSAVPPVVLLSVGKKSGVDKDTTLNLAEINEFVVNIATVSLAHAVELTSAEFARDEDEMAHAGLSSIASERVRPPRVAESPIHFECRLIKTLNLEGVETTMFFGEVLRYHVAESVFTNDRPDPEKIDPLVRLGAGTYSGITKPFKAGQKSSQV